MLLSIKVYLTIDEACICQYHSKEKKSGAYLRKDPEMLAGLAERVF